MRSKVDAMLGMSLFHRICTPEQRRSGSQLQSEKQKRERYSPLFFLRFHTLSRFFGAPSHSFYAMLGMSLFYRICTPEQRRSGSQLQSEKQKRERYSPLFFLRFHTLSRFFGAHSHSFLSNYNINFFLKPRERLMLRK